MKMAAPKQGTKMRLIVLLAVFTLLGIVLLGRVAYWQFAQGDRLQKEAIEQQTRDRVIESKRGQILDRNGKVLAISATVETVTCTPREVAQAKTTSPEQVAKTLSDILEMEYDSVYEKITQNSAYVVIKSKIEKDVADKIREANLPGIHLDEDSKRYYPFGSFAAQLIGACGQDNQGLFGIEAYYDKYLKGTPGRLVTATDVTGVELPYNYERYVDAEEGANVVLTIDEVIQHFAEKHLKQAMIDNEVENGGAVVVIAPKTGEILAMAVEPSFDLNDPFTIVNEAKAAELESLTGDAYQEAYSKALQEQWRNKAVVDSYEPGSVFKVITTAAALEENVVSDSDTFTCTGAVQVADRLINCWRSPMAHGTQNLAMGMQNSCNPVFIALGQRLGVDRFWKYVDAFGFMAPTGIDFYGETEGIFYRKESMTELDLSIASFGQGFQVTPLQVVSALSAIGNGGNLVKPHLVKQITDQNGNVIKSFGTETVRQVVSEETANKVLLMMESVVTEGTAKNAYVKGFRIGGKTGTSEKQPRNSGDYVSSFAGIAPVDDPQVVVLLMLDEPRSEIYTGGLIAAPVVGKIMEDVLTYLQVEPQYTEEEAAQMEINVANVVDMPIADAKAKLQESKLTVKVIGNGDTVLEQMPVGGIKVYENSQVILYTEENKEARVTVPDVKGYSVSEATRILAEHGLNIRVTGQGEAFQQDPAEGTEVSQGSVVTVNFRSADGVE